MGAHQRRKGANGEREAAALLTVISGFPWERAAQRSGKHQADVQPECPEQRRHCSLYVEVKRYVGGLAWWTRRVEERPDTLFLCEKHQIFFCGASSLMRFVDQANLAEAAPSQGSVQRWLLKAEQDAAPNCTPLVLCRQDEGPWIAAWRYGADDALMAVLRSWTA